MHHLHMFVLAISFSVVFSAKSLRPFQRIIRRADSKCHAGMHQLYYLCGCPMTASPRPCSTENWASVIEHTERTTRKVKIRAQCNIELMRRAPRHLGSRHTTTDCALWRGTCHGSLRCWRCDARREKRLRWMAIQPSSNIRTFVCCFCGRLCA